MTSLRFIAAAMIVVHHARGTFVSADHFLPTIPLSTGVSFFFVLSGFILTHVYPTLQGEGAARNFFIARFARIWPAHAFTFAIACMLGTQRHFEVSGAPPTAVVGLANAAMVHSWIPATGWFFSFNPVSWSISTEVFFYFAFPLLIANFPRTWPWKLGLALAVAAATSMACVYWKVPTFATAQPFEVNRAGLIYISPLVRVAEFVLGMAAALGWRRWSRRHVPGTVGGTLLEFGAIGICALCMVKLRWITNGDPRSTLSPLFTEGLAKYLAHAGIAPAFALLIAVFASHRGYVSRLLATPPLVLLGEISFSIYLLHRILLDSLKLTGIHLPADGPFSTLSWLAFWAVLLLVSWIVWCCVERPARSALLRLGGYRKTRPLPVTA